MSEPVDKGRIIHKRILWITGKAWSKRVDIWQNLGKAKKKNPIVCG